MIINIEKYINYVKEKEDYAAAIYQAVKDCAGKEPSVISFPKGVYHIYQDRCEEKYYFISNHDHGLKKIAFPLIDLKNIEIDGNGSELIFHGRIIPFLVDGCSNITIKNFKIDYERPFFTEGEILESTHDYVTLKINPDIYPFYVEDEVIHFYSENEWENTYIKWFYEFDVKRRTPLYKKNGTNNLREQKVKAELIERDIVKFKAKFRQILTKGNIANITHEQRYNPGIFITNSEDVLLENIDIYHAGAMGVIGQLSSNISLNNVNVTRRPGSSRMVSTNNDATHFINCEGLIKIENCTFEHQLDDATNIHGIYNVVSNVYTNTCIEVEIMHFQQNGINIFREGDRIAIVDKDTLLHKGYAIVNKTALVNQKFIRLCIEQETGSNIQKDDIIENFMRMPEVEIRNCRIGDNRARGLLLINTKRTIIENNLFYTSGTAIQANTGISHWYEAGWVDGLTVNNNKFVNCGYQKGTGIDSTANLSDPQNKKCINRNISIIDNEFYTFEPSILKLQLVENVRFCRNVIKRSRDFEPFQNDKYNLNINACEDLIIKDNIVAGFNEEKFIDADKRTLKTLNTSGNKF